METNPVYSNALSMIWLKKIMCEVFGDYDDIVESPPKDLLQKHGGDLTIEQFRAFGKQKTRIITHTMPFFTCALAFELVREYGVKKGPEGVCPIGSSIEKAQKDIKKIKRAQKKGTEKKDSSLSSLPPNNEIPLHRLLSPPIINSNPNNTTPPQLDLSDNHHQSSPVNSFEYDDTSGTTDNINISQRWDENSTTSIYPPPPPPPFTPPPINNNSNMSAESNHLLPDTITLVPANVGNRWEIRGLKRPDVPIKTPVIHTNPGKSMFQEYLEKKQNNKDKEPAVANTSSTTLTSNEPDTKSQKRRGRPKSTRVRPESPKNNRPGSLTSFLKM